MDNFNADDLDKINDMWNRVKFITFPMWVIYAVVGIVIAGGIAFIIIKFKDRIFINVRNKKKWHVVKKEQLQAHKL